MELNSYYDHISYLSQETPIFDTSIRGNIVFDHMMSDEEIYTILDKVHLKEKVLALPDQLDTLVGEGEFDYLIDQCDSFKQLWNNKSSDECVSHNKGLSI